MPTPGKLAWLGKPGFMVGASVADATVQVISEELQMALALDDNDADVHRVLAALKLIFNEHDKALYHQERALSLNPNSDLIVVQQGEVLTWLGRAEEGIEWIRRAMRLNPYHPERFWSHLGRAQYTARLYADAIASLQQADGARSDPSRLSCRVIGPIGKPHRRCCAHARSAAAAAGLHGGESPGNSALSAAVGHRTCARRVIEGRVAKLSEIRFSDDEVIHVRRPGCETIRKRFTLDCMFEGRPLMQPSNRVRCGAYGSDWHFATLLKLPYNGRFSNRPFGVKHFQTIHRRSVDVARGLVLLFGIGTKALPSWDSKTRWNNLLGGLAVRLTAGPSDHSNSPHPSSREGHHSTARWSSSFLLSDLILHGCHAAAASRVQRNSVPSTQMRCMITASRRASATIAFFIPRRLAICIAQAFSQDHLFECNSMLWAAS